MRSMYDRTICGQRFLPVNLFFGSISAPRIICGARHGIAGITDDRAVPQKKRPQLRRLIPLRPISGPTVGWPDLIGP
jgi:hypothetical protein